MSHKPWHRTARRRTVPYPICNFWIFYQDIQLGETPVYKLTEPRHKLYFMLKQHMFCMILIHVESSRYTATVIERRLHTVLLGTFPAMLLMCLSPWLPSPHHPELECHGVSTDGLAGPQSGPKLKYWPVEVESCYYDKLLLSFLHCIEVSTLWF